MNTNPPSYPRAVVRAIRSGEPVVLWRLNAEKWYYEDRYYPPPLKKADLKQAIAVGWFLSGGHLKGWTDMEFLPTATEEDRVDFQIAKLS